MNNPNLCGEINEQWQKQERCKAKTSVELAKNCKGLEDRKKKLVCFTSRGMKQTH